MAPEVARWHAFQKLQTEVIRRSGELLMRRRKILQAKTEIGHRDLSTMQKREEDLRASKAAAYLVAGEARERRDSVAAEMSLLETQAMAARKAADRAAREADRALAAVRQAQEAAEAGERPGWTEGWKMKGRAMRKCFLMLNFTLLPFARQPSNCDCCCERGRLPPRRKLRQLQRL